MAYSSISKLASQTVANKTTDLQAQGKTNPSKFDEVRSRLEKPTGAPEQQATQAAAPISPQERIRIEAEFKKRLEEVRLRDLDEIFKADLQKSKEQLDTTRRQLSSQLSNSAIDVVKSRLVQVEKQFLESGRLLKNIEKLKSPESYLKLQYEMYELNQNVELLSKIASEIVNGFNKIVNTSV